MFEMLLKSGPQSKSLFIRFFQQFAISDYRMRNKPVMQFLRSQTLGAMHHDCSALTMPSVSFVLTIHPDRMQHLLRFQLSGWVTCSGSLLEMLSSVLVPDFPFLSSDNSGQIRSL
jgi:hypothetical protein